MSQAGGSKLNVKLHKPFEIELGSGAISGYEWRPVFQEAVLKLLGKRHRNGARRFGASGRDIFKFEPLRTGSHNIAFELVRPFGNKSVERRAYSLHVD